MSDLRKHLPVFSRFLFVGATTAAIYFGVFALLHDMIGLGYRIAVSFGYGCGVAFHFLANRSLTFKDSEGHIPAQVVKYALVAGVNYVVTLIVVGAVVEGLGLSAYLGVVAAVAVTTLAGYVMFGRWVFRSNLTKPW